MGDYADIFADGTVDEITGELIDGDSPGYPRSKKRPYQHTRQQGPAKPFHCDKCTRRFKTKAAMEQHTNDSHKVN